MQQCLPCKQVAKWPVWNASWHALQEVKARLANIFKKIGDKASTELGLQELWQFQQEHPETDLTPHLARTSDQFRQYIQRGLTKVERRMQRSAGTVLIGLAAPDCKLHCASHIACLSQPCVTHIHS